MTRKKSSIVPAVITVATIGVAAGAAFLARNRKGELKEFVVNNILERPAGRSTYTELGQALQRAGRFLEQRIANASDTSDNRRVLSHIIGIERWGHNRLRMVLQQKPFERDEHHSYCPPRTSSLRQLQTVFSQTRIETIDLARQLHLSPPHDDFVIEHNSLGPLTAKGWLRYLTHHADLESRRLKGGNETEMSEAEQASSGH